MQNRVESRGKGHDRSGKQRFAKGGNIIFRKGGNEYRIGFGLKYKPRNFHMRNLI
jgi:hypothetical protein